MFAASPIGLQRPGAAPAHMAPRTYSGALVGRGVVGGAMLGLLAVGTSSTRHVEYTYSGVIPSRATLGMARPGLARVALPAARAGAARAKKQTGIPLRAAWQPGAATVQAALRTPWAVPRAEIDSPRQPWGASQPLASSAQAPWIAQRPDDIAHRLPWASHQPGAVAHIPARPGVLARPGIARPGLAPVGGAPPRAIITQPASAVQASERAAWVGATPVDGARRAAWSAYTRTADAPERSAYSASKPADAPRRLRWGVYGAHADNAARSAWRKATAGDTPERFVFGARSPLQGGWGVVIEPGIPTPGPGDTIIIPVQRAYIVLHDISVIRLPDNLPIPASDVRLSLDADSWSWSFSATLLGKVALDAVQPDSAGVPVTLEIALDGYVFRALVEDWSEDRTFGSRSVSVKGRGVSAQLAAPYQLPASGVTTADMTMQQVLNAHLPIGSGWTITWAPGTPDWLVPTGAWSWADQSPISAIFAACNGVGLVVAPAPAAQTLTIQPRYPVLPWNFATATPQITVPDAAIIQLGRRNAPPSQANTAFVAGGSVGGVLARVYRTGTAGDKALQPAQHPLITHTDAARVLGGRLLSGQAQQPAVRSLTIPFGGAFGMGTIGALLEAQIDGVATRGLVNGVQIATQRTERGTTIRQTLTLGEDTPNVWSGFARMLPQDPLRIATILATFADGTATVQYPGSGTQRVRNPQALAAGASVYVRGGRIDGTAPTLTQSDITI